ncbi:MAG: hypothetical protein NTY45_03900, partial [Elusimicrobia bacterium]|nr:hypothetical protein [Elusimicrobiota bacterium]
APKGAAAPVVSTAPAVAAAPEISTAPVAAAAPVAPAAVKPANTRPQSCPNCFLPLLTGYNSIVDELKTWTDEMAAQATALDQTLSDIQGRIDEKDNAIAKARLGTDKKAVKAEVKGLTKERKLLLKEYSAASDKKADFYKQFSDEIEKRTNNYNKATLKKLGEAQAAAAQEY